jgi:acetolactate synthase-1/2/3 large subunit
MGYGLPAAIGAQIANPEKLVVCVSGDASVLMNIQELSTAVQHQTPVKLVLCNNRYMGMVRQWQELAMLAATVIATLLHCRLRSCSKGLRLGRKARKRSSQLDAAIAECFAYDGPFFLDVTVAAQENCFPMIAAGCGHHQVMRDERSFYPV